MCTKNVPFWYTTRSGCDINGNGVPDLRSGEPVPEVGAGTGAVR